MDGDKRNNDDNHILAYLLGLYLLAIAPLFRRLKRSAKKELEKIQKDVEKLPEAKRKSKRTVQQYQKRYTEAIAPSLNIAQEAQDAFLTAALCNTFEYSYYRSAYEIEQSAKTAVNIPRLNRKGVTRIIATDWVGDRHSYSDRIRANTQLVATHAKTVIKDLVKNSDSYNKAAHDLSKRIGESYDNAIRIVRTEMTRINSVAASYAAMENADLYEGKYRDATFDSRTSPYCRLDADYSRTHLYPVDYDTPENPGTPGHRIPNHPNCRCNWRFVLKGMGVPTDGKIARKNDSKNSYGENYYTKANTFDEYAKERGLPITAELVAKDNPKRYLRPGETLEDLKRATREQRQAAKGAPLFEKPLDKSSGNGIMKSVKDVRDVQSGAFYGALNPESDKDFKRCEEHAYKYYAEIRKRKSDISAIAKNTGFDEDKVKIIKSHIFINKYDLGENEPTTFDPSYDIAVSWQNLIEGKHIEPKDIILLEHEYYEYTLMKTEGLSYRQAHAKAQEIYNYQKAVNDWRSKQ